jgi:uncharacterized protein (DUF1501 family)
MSNENGCSEYRGLSRRGFLYGAGKAAILGSTLPAWLPKVVLAQDFSSSRDVMISIYLRGGADGLTMCVPFGDPNYYRWRTQLGVAPPDSSDPNKAINLDGFFGLPPALAPLMEAFQDGSLLIAHATGSTDPSRSHFDAQRFMEVGKPRDPNLGSGWLGRHLATTPPVNQNAPLRAVGLNYGLQQTLKGGPKALPIPDLDRFGFTGNAGTLPQRSQWLQQRYEQTGDPLKSNARHTQATIDLLDRIDFANYVPAGGAVYPNDSFRFGYAMKSVAALIRADVGVEAVHLDLGGWDTHAAQGVFSGTMANLMDALAKALAALHKDLFAANRRDFTVAVLSEFGRVVAENGSGGTDHGHGNSAMFLGGNVRGGRVLANWPGLARDQLHDGQDLRVTIDYRDLLAEIVQKRLGNSNLGVVFPDYTPTFRGIVN